MVINQPERERRTMRAIATILLVLMTTTAVQAQIGKTIKLETMEYVVHSIIERGGKTQVMLTVVSRAPKKTPLPLPAVVRKNPIKITVPSSSNAKSDYLQPNQPVRITFTVDAVGDYVRIYGPGFNSQRCYKDISVRKEIIKP